MFLILLIQKPLGTKFLEFFIHNYFQKFKNSVLVFSNSKPMGWWNDNNIAKLCNKHQIPMFDSTNKIETLELLALFAKKFDDVRVVSVQFPWIIDEMILNSLKILPINLHLADISKYRGWNSFSHAILNNDSNYSWNLHEVNRIVDTGQILLSKNIDIHSHDTAKSLYQKTIESASDSFSEVMDILLGNKSLVTSSLANIENSPFYGKDSLKIYSLIESEKYNVQSLNRISRALYFPPYPSPLLRKDGASQPLLPLPVPDCHCESCNELRVYFSRF